MRPLLPASIVGAGSDIGAAGVNPFVVSEGVARLLEANGAVHNDRASGGC